MSIRIFTGDCREVMAAMAPESVHCVVTSPPYWGLRDYKLAPTVWGGEAGCEHKWGTESKSAQRLRNGEGSDTAKQAVPVTLHPSTGRFCRRCGAWSGAHGLEPTIELYVKHEVEIFRAVRRVLRRDGTLWLNLGDSFAGGGQGNGGSYAADRANWRDIPTRSGQRAAVAGLKPKDLCMMPARVALALQADGWWLRQDIIWSKPNPMPESVTDRCTKAHEYLFLLSKSERYFYDAEAIKEPGVESDRQRNDRIGGANGHLVRHSEGTMIGASATRNRRSVWEIATAPFPEAHFATFPPALVVPCIKAGTSEKGCCAKCVAPWMREVERERIRDGEPLTGSFHGLDGTPQKISATGVGHWRDRTVSETLGWSPSCSCNAEIVPATVFDPFAGAGTVGLVADRLQRDAVLIDLNPEYAAMAERRIRDEAGVFADIHTKSCESLKAAE